jgi:hypothetical protein
VGPILTESFRAALIDHAADEPITLAHAYFVSQCVGDRDLDSDLARDIVPWLTQIANRGVRLMTVRIGEFPQCHLHDFEKRSTASTIKGLFPRPCCIFLQEDSAALLDDNGVMIHFVDFSVSRQILEEAGYLDEQRLSSQVCRYKSTGTLTVSTRGGVVHREYVTVTDPPLRRSYTSVQLDGIDGERVNKIQEELKQLTLDETFMCELVDEEREDSSALGWYASQPGNRNRLNWKFALVGDVPEMWCGQMIDAYIEARDEAQMSPQMAEVRDILGAFIAGANEPLLEDLGF